MAAGVVDGDVDVRAALLARVPAHGERLAAAGHARAHRDPDAAQALPHPLDGHRWEAVAAADKEMEERANRAKELLSRRYVGLKRHQVSLCLSRLWCWIQKALFFFLMAYTLISSTTGSQTEP